jgi:uncharacterized membrane protein (GlpM family)
VAWLIIKYLLSALLVIAIGELSRRSGRLGALLASLPLVALLAMLWMRAEKRPPEQIAEFARLTFWYVLPTLPMFLAFPWLQVRFGFWWAILLGLVLSCGSLLLLAVAMRLFGTRLI